MSRIVSIISGTQIMFDIVSITAELACIAPAIRSVLSWFLSSLLTEFICAFDIKIWVFVLADFDNPTASIPLEIRRAIDVAQVSMHWQRTADGGRWQPQR